MGDASGDSALLAAGRDAATVRLREWRFGGRFVEGCTAPDFDDSAFAVVTVPHCVADLSWQEWDPASWAGEWIYRCRFGRPVGGERTFLDFDGVMSAATVTVNGRAFPKHLGGYLPVSYEITDLIGEDNLVAVVVDGRWLNVPPDGAPDGSVAVDYQQPAGVYREVRLRTVPDVFVADVFAKPVDVLRAERRLEVQCTIDAAQPIRYASVQIALRAGDQTLDSTTVDIAALAAGPTLVAASLDHLTEVRLWDVTDPQLYDVVVTLARGNSAVHERSVRTGFREARFELDGFFLNGRRLKIFGLNRHQIYPYVGMAMPGRVQRHDAEILAKDFNCNMVRCAHYPQSPDFLDACDELGLMVWEEPPGWQYVGDDQWRELLVRDVRDMIVRDRNRPSIVVWGVQVNESAPYPELYTRTKRLAYDLDGTRQTSGSLTSQSTVDWVQDVFAYDDYNHDEHNALLRPPVPDVPYLVAESVGALSGPHYYRWTDDEQTLAQQAFLHAQVHDTVASDDRYAGLLGWVAFDYASQNGFTYKAMKKNGVADIFRVAKPGAAFYRSQVDPRRRPVLEPAFFWDVSRHSGEALIGSNCDRLELYLDGAHYATAWPDSKRFPHLPYPPYSADLPEVATQLPELRIDGFLGDELFISGRMAADPAGDRLELTADDDHLVADGADATRVAFRAVDTYGNYRPNVTGDVALSLTGPAVLIGDNPFSFADTPGAGAVWVKTMPARTGRVMLTAAHPRLGSARVHIEVR